MSADIEVRRSQINGRGVFALRAFAEGEVVLTWDTSRLIARAAKQALPAEEQHYLFPFDEKSFVLMQPPARYVNHSCDNNTDVRGFSDVAVRAIAPGEEITSNYFTQAAQTTFECRCGSSNCISRRR